MGRERYKNSSVICWGQDAAYFKDYVERRGLGKDRTSYALTNQPGQAQCLSPVNHHISVHEEAG